VAVINAPDLTPILRCTDVKEINEVVEVTCAETDLTTPISCSLKVAELPTTNAIDVSALIITREVKICVEIV